MLEPNKKFDVPFGYFSQHIDKDLRIKIFQAIITGYEKRYPRMERVCAYLNWDMQHDFDFMYIVKTTLPTKIEVYYVNMPFFGSRHTIQGFYYCLGHDKVEEYFEDGINMMAPFNDAQFKNIIKALGLSLYKFDHDATGKAIPNPTYWKSKQNLPKLAAHLKNIMINFVPR